VSVPLPVHFVDATRDAIRAYSRTDPAPSRGSRGSHGSGASRRSSGASLTSSTRSAASDKRSYHSGVSSSVRAPVVETLYSGSASGRTTPSGHSLASSSSATTQPSWMTKSNDWTTTGNSTDRSSVYSLGDWGEDEFDKATTRKVKGLFEDVDSWMFETEKEKEGSLSQTSLKECHDWVERFPHFRTLGSQLLAPKDGGGYEVVLTDNRPPTGSILMDVTDDVVSVIQDLPYALCLNGKAVKAIPVPMEGNATMKVIKQERTPRLPRGSSVSSSSGPVTAKPEDLAHLVEEIFEEDGKFEEYLAYDARKIDLYSSSQPSIIASNRTVDHPPFGRSKHPPVTPVACLKDSIMGAVFDLTWSAFISLVQHLMQNYHHMLRNEAGITPRPVLKGPITIPGRPLYPNVGHHSTIAEYPGRMESSGSGAAIGLDSVRGAVIGLDTGRPISRLSTLNSRYTSMAAAPTPDFTLGDVLTICRKELHHQQKPAQQQHVMTSHPSQHHDTTSGPSHGEDPRHIIRESSQTPLNLLHSVNSHNSGTSLGHIALSTSPSTAMHRGHTSIATISLTSNHYFGGGGRTSVRNIESATPNYGRLGSAGQWRNNGGPRVRSRTILQPLDKPKTPVIEDKDEGLSRIGFDGVIGIGIVNVASPPMGLPRNLPPLETETASPLRIGTSKRKNSFIRASSAISDKNGRETSGAKTRTLRGPPIAGVAEGDDRPNTTHTFRNDLNAGYLPIDIQEAPLYQGRSNKTLPRWDFTKGF